MKHIPVLPVSAKMWRDALGPGYAVGPSGRMIEMLSKSNGEAYRAGR